MRTWKTYAAWCLALALAGGMLWLVIREADAGLLVARLRGASTPMLGLVVASYLATLWLRAARFRFMLEPAARTADWYALTALHNFYFTFVPFKLGEASFLALVRQRGVRLARAAPALLLSRLYELAVLLLFGLVGMVGLGVGQHYFILLTLAVAILALIGRAADVVGALARVAGWLHGRTGLDGIGRLAASIGDSLEWVRSHRQGSHMVAALSVGVCALANLSVWFAFLAMDAPVSATMAMFFYAGLALFGVLGVFTVAGIGVSELGLAGLLVLAGFSLGESAVLALLVRLVLLLVTLAGTGIAWLLAAMWGSAPASRTDR